ncbi:MAG: hypothetical protein ACXV76_13970 [Halobacteriota archaeon]
MAPLLTHELLEIHRSKISILRAKADYHHPIVRLPHHFSTLTGLPTRIYQTVHKGALAFLVVISATSAAWKAIPLNLKMAGYALNPPYSHGGGRRFESG